MTKPRGKTLIVGPIGDRPWLTIPELVQSLEDRGDAVVVNGEPDEVLPLPPALRSGLAQLAFDWVAWRNRARGGLRRAGVERILVWDPVLVVVCRAARASGIEIVWAAPAIGASRRDRMAHAMARRCADRLVAAPLPRPSQTHVIVPGWVVFGPASAVNEATLQALRARADDAPAAALIFDNRKHEGIAPAELERLIAAARPRAVWWCGDDEWATRLGGVTAVAVDPAPAFVPDHRHLLALAAGATVLRTADQGWAEASSDGELLDDERDWAQVALG